ncbi:helix-turn-helix domain-containing protein [Cellvibrio sp. OA-2007]|uniref:helix-turn-helix domain-containing protein n=1 Tax=Cellvibrio sp. OA-2007 TaxID=529823 RepID=UPI000784A6CF|nr:AraC family transcriptional regulator [Cellvibrio sp. OA-2007]
MNDLIHAIKTTVNTHSYLPFAVYSSLKEQRIFNVPIIKPVLIVVLDGEKRLGKDADVICSAGSFIFLSNNPMLDMRNIPSEREYFALLIEFEQQDFAVFNSRPKTTQKYLVGTIEKSLQTLLQQFIEWSAFAPPALWPIRRAEILQYLDFLGYHPVRGMAGDTRLSQKLHDLVRANLAEDLSSAEICAQLAMSESTLRRKLQAEGTSVQDIKDQTKLGYGLHLLQTSADSIGTIAELCGYQSQSRFSERFKQRFGLTPSELRKTKLHESGEHLAVLE